MGQVGAAEQAPPQCVLWAAYSPGLKALHLAGGLCEHQNLEDQGPLFTSESLSLFLRCLELSGKVGVQFLSSEGTNQTRSRKEQ